MKPRQIPAGVATALPLISHNTEDGRNAPVEHREGRPCFPARTTTRNDDPQPRFELKLAAS